MAGSIKLFRQFLDWEWYQDENVKSVFIHLLLTANYKDLRWQGKLIKRGQLVTSREKLAALLGKSEQNIRTALDKLVMTKEIVKQSTNKYTIITICNYDKWQSNDGFTNQQNNQQVNQQLTNEQPTTNQQLTTSKEREEYKEREEINNSLSPHTCAYACESENPEEVKWLAQMKRGFTAWQADACRTLKIDQETLTRYIEEFEVEQRAKSMVHHSWADITSHFIDWGRIHRDFELKQQKQESYGKRNDNRFGVEPSKDANYYEPI